MSDADLNRPPNLVPPYGRKSVAGQLGKMSRAINRGNQGVDPPYQVLAAVAAEGAAAAEPDIITVVAMSGANVALTGLCGFATAGLLLSALLTYVSNIPLLDINMPHLASLSPMIQQSRLMQLMIFNQDLFFSLPALVLIGAGYTGNK